MTTVISVTRLNGRRFYLNPELIEVVEVTPDTVILLTTGRRLVVLEAPEDIRELFVGYQREKQRPPGPKSGNEV